MASNTPPQGDQADKSNAWPAAQQALAVTRPGLLHCSKVCAHASTVGYSVQSNYTVVTLVSQHHNPPQQSPGGGDIDPNHRGLPPEQLHTQMPTHEQEAPGNTPSQGQASPRRCDPILSEQTHHAMSKRTAQVITVHNAGSKTTLVCDLTMRNEGGMHAGMSIQLLTMTPQSTSPTGQPPFSPCVMQHMVVKEVSAAPQHALSWRLQTTATAMNLKTGSVSAILIAMCI
jgi:hypothetical protein